MNTELDLSKLSDHDLLLVLHTTVARISQDVKEMKDGTSQTLAELKLTKAEKTTTDDHETRLRAQENFRALVKGALIISNAIILPILFYLLFKIALR